MNKYLTRKTIGTIVILLGGIGMIFLSNGNPFIIFVSAIIAIIGFVIVGPDLKDYFGSSEEDNK